jgi:hypothetical protein
MISKDGKNLGFQKNQQLVVKNLKWFVSSTRPTISIRCTTLVPVIQN